MKLCTLKNGAIVWEIDEMRVQIVDYHICKFKEVEDKIEVFAHGGNVKITLEKDKFKEMFREVASFSKE